MPPAAFEAMRAYENHCNQNGDPGSHEKAKKVLFVPLNQRFFSTTTAYT